MQSKGRTVLVVEDDALVRSVTRRLLESCGYEVLLAEGPADAVETYRNAGDAIDLVITDVSMPEMSGPDLAVQLRSLNAGLKILFLSGDSSAKIPADRQSGFLAKPFSREELLLHAERLLEGGG